MSTTNKYEVKKQGFTVTKDEKEEREREKKREKLMLKVDKLNLEKAEHELDALKRSSYLAPHQHERRHFLEQAVSILKKQHAAAAEAAAPAASSDAEKDLPSRRNPKRLRGDDGSSSDDDAGHDERRGGSKNELSVDAAWAEVLTFASASNPIRMEQPRVVQHAGALSASTASGAMQFVPRTVKKPVNVSSQPLSTDQPVADDERGIQSRTCEGSNDVDVDAFLDDLV